LMVRVSYHIVLVSSFLQTESQQDREFLRTGLWPPRTLRR
jgi:hypothetical protein